MPPNPNPKAVDAAVKAVMDPEVFTLITPAAHANHRAQAEAHIAAAEPIIRHQRDEELRERLRALPRFEPELYSYGVSMMGTSGTDAHMVEEPEAGENIDRKAALAIFEEDDDA